MAIVLSVSWLSELLGQSIDDVTALSERLSIQGLETEVIESSTANMTHVVVGEVVKTIQHPNADRLRVCDVNIGEATLLSIVCGCPSVTAGMRVPVALIGAQLPEILIKESKLRGVVSQGMLCTSMELGFSSKKQPLLCLPNDAPLGVSIVDYLKLDQYWLSIDVTPNRGDCLSAIGVAREVAVILSQPIKWTHHFKLPLDGTKTRLEDQACTQYAHACIQSVNTHATIPYWIEQRLFASGIHRVNAVVDILNYVMLLLGQPMHAFDLERVHGQVYVRKSKQGEQLVLLNDSTIHLNQDLVIADDRGPIALAGIMGGLNSAITDKTSSIFIESAVFEGNQISRSSKYHGLQTDASYRYERSIDPGQVCNALAYAVELILDICGGKLVSSASIDHTIPTDVIHFDTSLVKQYLGYDADHNMVCQLLESLQFNVRQHSENKIHVSVPTFRNDIKQPIDLIEEIGRLIGYEKIQNVPIVITPTHQSDVVIHQQQMMSRSLIARGYQEIMSYGLLSKSYAQQFENSNQLVCLDNPLSEEFEVLRTSIVSSLLLQADYCINHGVDAVKFFEFGKCFPKSQVEYRSLGLLVYGLKDQYSFDRRNEIDHLDLMGDISVTLGQLFPNQTIEFSQEDIAPPQYFHPKQCAQIQVGGHMLGWVGHLHPTLSQSYDEHLIVAEMNVSTMNSTDFDQLKPQESSCYQACIRDLSLLVKSELTNEKILACIHTTNVNHFKKAYLIDVYQDSVSGNMYYTYRIVFQSHSKTLKEKEIVKSIDLLIKSLEEVGITLRESMNDSIS